MKRRRQRRRNMRPVAVLFVDILLACVPIASVAWVELSSDDGRTEDFASATFRYFGQQKLALLPSTPTIFVNAPDACTTVPDDVLGKVVIMTPSVLPRHLPCKPGEMYAAYDKAGALALLVEIARRPGIFTFWYDAWDSNAYRGHSLIMLMVPIEATRGFFEEDEVTVRIGLPHDTAVYDAYTSWGWIILMRVLIPLLATWAAVVAYGELRRQMALVKEAGMASVGPTVALQAASGSNALPQAPGSRGNTRHSAPLRLACLLETASMTVTAIAMACGQHGPYALPGEVMLFSTTLLSGGQNLSTIVILLLMNEKLSLLEHPRNLPAGKAIPAFFLDHKEILAFSFALTFGLDASFTLMVASGVLGIQNSAPFWRSGDTVMVVLTAVASILQLVCGALCIFQARKITAIQGGHPTIEGEIAPLSPQATTRGAILSHVAFWLKVIGMLHLVQHRPAILAIASSAFSSSDGDDDQEIKDGAILMLALVFLLAVRCLKSLAQTQAMKPHGLKVIPAWTSRTLLCGAIRGLWGVRDATVVDETYPSFHESQDSFFFLHPDGNPTPTSLSQIHGPNSNSAPGSVIASTSAYSAVRDDSSSKGDVQLSSSLYQTDD